MTIRATGTRSRVPVTAFLPIGLAALALAVLASLLFGARVISVGEVLGALGGDKSVAATVIWELRVPRTLLGLLVGACLGAAGVLAQSATRNPLADPGLLGISSGAAVAIVVGSAFFGIAAGPARVGLALVGAALATIAVYAFAARSPEGITPVNMTLAGMALTALLGAVVSGVVLFDAATMDQYRFWVVGALSVPTPAILIPATVCAAGGAVLAVAMSGSLNTLALGDDTAAGLGVKVMRTRVLAGAAVVLLSGTAVALAGPIAFVGLIIPHMARAIVGQDVRRVLVTATVLGPVLLLAADVLGRVVARPAEVQAGVVTALVGTPFFIWLTRRPRRRERLS